MGLFVLSNFSGSEIEKEHIKIIRKDQIFKSRNKKNRKTSFHMHFKLFSEICPFCLFCLFCAFCLFSHLNCLLILTFSAFVVLIIFLVNSTDFGFFQFLLLSLTSIFLF